MDRIMNSEFFNVYVDDNCVAQKMPLQFALVLTKAIYGEFYAEPELKVTIQKVAQAEIINAEVVDDKNND